MPERYNWIASSKSLISRTTHPFGNKEVDDGAAPPSPLDPNDLEDSSLPLNEGDTLSPDLGADTSSNENARNAFYLDPTPTERPANDSVVAKASYDYYQGQPLEQDNRDVPGVVARPNIQPAKLGSEMIGLESAPLSLENSAQLGWREFFNDPALVSLIDQALVGNQELKILAQEIRIACLEVQSRSGEYLPFVTLGAGAGLEKSGRHTRAGAVEEQLDVIDGGEFPDPLPDFLAAADVSWEVDIWHKLRNAQNAAALRYLGTQEGQNYVITRLVAEVAEDYYELLGLDNRLLTLDKTIQLQEQSLKVAEAVKQAGRGTELAVQRFQAEVQKNLSEKLIIEQEIIEAENRINFRLGRFPQPIERISVEYIDINLQSLAAGVPSQLLQNRADIREAERKVEAAGLDVSVARARFYPSLTLRGGLGWNAFRTGYLFRTPESLIYSLAGELVGPLINKRAIKADYLSANAMQLQAIYDYQRTVLVAHIEVVNHMTKVDNYSQSIEVKKQQLRSLEASVDSATKLFQNARAEYVEVLLAQRDFMEAKMDLIETKQQQLSAMINAYQSLGGGSNGTLLTSF